MRERLIPAVSLSTPCVALHVGCGDALAPFELLALAELFETGVADTIVESPGHLNTTNESTSAVAVVSGLASSTDWVVTASGSNFASRFGKSILQVR